MVALALRSVPSFDGFRHPKEYPALLSFFFIFENLVMVKHKFEV